MPYYSVAYVNCSGNTTSTTFEADTQAAAVAKFMKRLPDVEFLSCWERSYGASPDDWRSQIDGQLDVAYYMAHAANTDSQAPVYVPPF